MAALTLQDRRRRLPRAEREQQLLAVAQELFAERGFRSVSMDEVALRAGVTKPILYDHFGSKDGLVVATIRQAGEQLAADIAAAIEGVDGPAALLEAGFTGFFTFAETHGRGWFTLLGDDAVAGGAALELEAIRRQQAAFVAERLAASMPRARPEDVDAYAQAVIGACERIALWRRDRPALSAATATRLLMSLLWGGLASLSDGADAGA